MDSGLLLVVAAGVFGVAIGWFIGRARVGRLFVKSARANTELTTQVEAERARVVELREELRAEQLLLDEVATRTRMSPRSFREALARDYLHPADPYRAHHLPDGVIDLTDKPSRSTEFQPPRALASELAARDRALDQIEASLRELRRDVEALVCGRAESTSAVRSVDVPRPGTASDLHAGRKVVELREEVSTLRLRLAERQVDADRLAQQLAATEPDAGLRQLSAELADLRARVLELHA